MSNESAETGLFDRTLGTGDHKTIGRLWIFAGLGAGLMALIVRLVVAVEQVDTGSISLVKDANELVQVWSISRDVLVFGGAVAVLIGVGTFIVPLQVGASSIAFPRGAAAAFWLWAASLAMLVGAYLGNGGPGGGTSDFVVLWAMALGGLMLAVLWALICIATTVIDARAPGMKLEMAPLTSWSFLVFTILGLLTIPIQIGQLIVTYLDVRGGYQPIGDTTGLAAVLDTITIAPSVYWFAIPGLGIALDVIAVHTGRPLRFHKSALGALGVLTLSAFGAAITSFGRRGDAIDFNNSLFVVALLLSVLPILGSLALGSESLKGGSPTFTVPLLSALLSGLLALGGAVVALLGVVEPIVGFVVDINNSATGADDVADLPDSLLLNGTTFNAGITAFIIGAALLAGLAGISHWSHKIWGRRLSPGLGSLAVLALAGGAAVWAVGEILGGVDGQPALPEIADTDGLAAVGNLLVLIGVASLAAGVGLTLLAVIGAGVLGNGSESEPWTGTTLEWLADSPPSYGNFDSQPTVSSANPLLDMDLTAGTDNDDTAITSPEAEEVSA